MPQRFNKLLEEHHRLSDEFAKLNEELRKKLRELRKYNSNAVLRLNESHKTLKSDMSAFPSMKH